jgi:hypothetical protein
MSIKANAQCPTSNAEGMSLNPFRSIRCSMFPLHLIRGASDHLPSALSYLYWVEL